MDILLRFIRQTSQRQFLKMCSRWISFISREKYFSLLSTNFLIFHLNVVVKFAMSLLRPKTDVVTVLCFQRRFSDLVTTL